jgi:hypothetical protein
MSTTSEASNSLAVDLGPLPWHVLLPSGFSGEGFGIPFGCPDDKLLGAVCCVSFLASLPFLVFFA